MEPCIPLFEVARLDVVAERLFRASARLHDSSGFAWLQAHRGQCAADALRSPFNDSEPTAMTIVRMTDLDLSGKRVLIRQGEPV